MVANGADSNISRGEYVTMLTRYWQSDRMQVYLPATTPARLYKNNTQLAGSANINVPENVLRNDNYIGHDSWGSGNIDAEIAEVIIYNYR